MTKAHFNSPSPSVLSIIPLPIPLSRHQAVDVWHYDGEAISSDMTDLRALTDALNEDFPPSTPSSAPSYGALRRSSHRSSTSSLDGGVASPSSYAGGEGYQRDELERAVRRYAARYNGGGGSGAASSFETPRGGGSATQGGGAPVAVANGFFRQGASGMPGAASSSTALKPPAGAVSREFGDDVVVNGIPVLSYLPNEAPLRLVPADQSHPAQKVIAPSAAAESAASKEPENGQFEDSEESGVGQKSRGEDVDIAAPVVRAGKVDMCCQTMSTGPILATGIYMDS